ncbi:MAG: DUF805 domain-containing protein [Bacteroidaceae bacterium]|nr:DUF805 domain-containing protein [Bacteroidaceae bacterium]
MPTIIDFCKRAYSLQGRARRIEYALWSIFAFVCFLVFYTLAWQPLFAVDAIDHSHLPRVVIGGIAFVLFALVPHFCAAVRRHHDFGKSGTWALMFFIPLWGQIWALVITVIDTQPRDNRFGPNPKAKVT